MSLFSPDSLKLFVQFLKKVPDPRSRRGQSHLLHTLLTLTLLGLLANCTNPTELQRWAENHLPKLRTFLRFRYRTYRNKAAKWCVPHALTFSRLFEKLSLAEFLNALLQDATIVVAVDGKAAKQMKDDNGEVIREMFGISGCRSLIRLDKEIRREGEEPSIEIRYYISSLDPDKVSAKDFQAYILGHWEVENCLHLQKDRYYDEDKHVCGSDGGKEWTILTNMALSLAQLLKKGERTLKEIRERCCIDPIPWTRKLEWNRETC